MRSDHSRPEEAAKPRRQAGQIARNAAARAPEGLVPSSPAVADLQSAPDQARQLLHELQVHQSELEAQNEDLRRAHEELEAARARYFDLYDLAPVGYVTLSEEGLILEANLTTASLLGVTRGALVRQPFAQFIHREDQDAYYLHCKQLFGYQSTLRQGSAQAGPGQAGEPQECELRMLTRDGAAFWVSLSATLAQDESGAPTCRVVMIGITERKRAEEVPAFLARTSSGTTGEPFFESLARYLGDSLQMDFVCIDRLEGDGLTARTLAVWCDGKFEDNVAYALKDTPCGDVVGKSVCCFPASVCQFFPRDQVLLDLRAESYVGVTLWSHAGQPIGLIAVIGRRPLANRSQVEATLKLVAVRAAAELERLDAELALRVSADRHRTILQTAMDGLWLVDSQGRLLESNETYCRMSGYSQPELLTIRVSDLEAVETPDVVSEHIRSIKARGVDRFESRHRRKDGSVFDVEVSAQYLPIEGGRIVAFVRDTTERKQAELALQESEEKYRLVAEFTHDWEYWLGFDGKFRYVSPSCQRITGYAAGEFLQDAGLLLRIVHPDDAAAVSDHLRVAQQSGPRVSSLNFRIITRDGLTRWIGHSCQAVRSNDGTWLGERASNRDITQWVEEQQQLRLRTDQLEALQQIGVSLTSELDLETLLQSIVSRATAMFHAAGGALFTYRPDSDVLEWSVGVGVDPFMAGTLLKRGEGLTGRVWESGQAIAVADYHRWPGRAAVLAHQRIGSIMGAPIGSIMGAPIRWGVELLGVLDVMDSQTRAFNDDEKRQLELFANVAAVAMRNARALSDEATQRRRAEALARAATAVANSSDLGAVLQNLLNSAISAVPQADGGAVFLRDEERDMLLPRAIVGLADDESWTRGYPTDQAAAQLDIIVHAADPPLPPVAAEPDTDQSGASGGARSVIAAPLRIRDRDIGSILLTSATRSRAFSPADQSLLAAFADQSAIAVEHARLLADAQTRAVLEERQRLARDLHDSVTQSLYGLTLFTHAAREWADAGDLESTRGQLVQVADTAQQALKDMRLLVYELRPADFAVEGLAGALRHRLNSVERRAGIDAHIWVELEADLPAAVEDAFYRVAQEALNNAVKHAAARRVDVYLRSWPGGAEVEVKDDGAGFDLVQAPSEGLGGGMGLITMRERSERIGGTFAIQSAPGKGTTVRMAVALPDGRQGSP